MISAGEPQEFIPLGRMYLDKHPGDVYLPVESATTIPSSADLLRAFKGVSLREQEQTEQWLLKKINDDFEGEEELYFSGKTVIWSKSSGYGVQDVCKCFTVEFPVQQVLYANFNFDRCMSNWIAKSKPDVVSRETAVSGVCIMDTSKLSFYTETGTDYTADIPFQVAKSWKCKYGLLFERNLGVQKEKNENGADTSKRDLGDERPVVFSMLHPLDDVAPVIKKTGTSLCAKLSHLDDPSEQIVFVSSNPSLVLTYSGTDGVHSVWRLRMTSVQEVVNPCLRIITDPPGMTKMLGHSSVLTNTSSHSKHTSSAQASAHTPSFGSPLRSHPSSRVSSPSGLQSHSASPSVSNLTHMATLSRSQSPSINKSAAQKYNFTPTSSGAMAHLSPLSSSESECSIIEPLLPDLCFDLEWTEPRSHCPNESPSKASKGFLSKDITNQAFLCYLIKEKQQLKMMKFEDSNYSYRWNFESTHVLPAADAESLPSLNLLIILESNGSLTLYTGLTKVSKVHVSNMAGPFHDYPRMSSRRTSRLFGTPRRSSLASSRPPSGMDVKFSDEVQQLSPVPPVHIENSPPLGLASLQESTTSYSSMGVIIGLRDAVQNRVTLESFTGLYFRITIPYIAESLIVVQSLRALRSVLPRDTFTHVLTKWYATRNAPGSSDMSSQSELKSFLLCLMSIIGYNTDCITLGGVFVNDLYSSPAAVKKQKTNENGSDEDWSYVLSSHTNESLWKRHGHIINIERKAVHTMLAMEPCKINTCALLYPYMAHVLYALHLVYEDSKLNVTLWGDLPKLCTMLFEISRDLNLEPYKDYYWRDFPEQVKGISEKPQLSAEELAKSHFPVLFSSPTPPSIFSWMQDRLRGLDAGPFPYIPNVTLALRDMVLVYAMLTSPSVSKRTLDSHLYRIIAPELLLSGRRGQEYLPNFDVVKKGVPDNVARKNEVVQFLTKLGITVEDMYTLPVGVALVIQDAILHCRNRPQSNWKEKVYNLIGRQDLAMLHLTDGGKIPPASQKSKYCGELSKYGVPKDSEDGLDYLDHEVLRLRFSRDHRVHDVYRMLQSSKPVRIVLQQRPEVSDHEFIEEQERHLYSLCIRTMALPVGRGMFTLRTCKPVVTETLPIPKLCLTGRAPPRNTTVDLSHIDVPANMNMWPLFHNGVAAGLRIAPNASQIDSTWMVYNKPRSSSNDTPTEHAGFLMALGLNGHLANLTSMSIHDYLCKGHELTSVGILLGVATANRGTMDVGVTKLLSIHIEALLPPTSTELDVPPVVQVAAVLGIGLLYQGSGHHHIAEILMGEIGRPPGPEMEHCVDRESYALAAGLALGLVTFAKGKDVSGLTDLPMADQLYHYMVGAHKRPLTGIHKEKHKSPSYQIREGDSVNVDVTSPGATLALGMMFFDTGNEAIAEWMTAPDTQCLLDMVRPDFLLLRTLSKGLIMWSNVHPSRIWVKSHIPEIVSKYAFKRGQSQGMNSDIDYETMSQAFCNIIAGCCLCLGLKFAGSANKEAFDTLMHYTKIFLSITGKSLADQAGKSTIETCLNVCVLSLAMVMAGRGDLDVLRICRHLRSRVSQSSSYVLYGSHMATHMALGLLFLGGGRFTLSTSPLAVGAMICSFFPKFPTHSNDNRYHLQAFYHLYVLAVEPRLIIPRHIDTNKPVYTHIRIRFKDTPWYENVEYVAMAPCILPELDLLKEVVVEDKRYWPIVFECDKNWDTLRNLLNSSGTLYVKQKAGCLPYSEDPQGFRSLLAQNFIKNNVHGWNLKNIPISQFSSDPLALNFASSFLHYSPEAVQEKEWQQKTCELLFEYASQEKMEILPSCVKLIQMGKEIHRKRQNLDIWQTKLLQAYSHWRQYSTYAIDSEQHSLIKEDLVVSVRKDVEVRVKEQIQGTAENQEFLMRYLYGNPEYHNLPSSLASFLVLHDVPVGSGFDVDISDGNFNFPLLYLKLQNLKISVSSLMSIFSALTASAAAMPV